MLVRIQPLRSIFMGWVCDAVFTLPLKKAHPTFSTGDEMRFLVESDYLPWCDKCGKHVDMLNQDHHVGSDKYVYTVFCHGESEEVVITKNDFVISMEMDAILQPGVAFKEK